MRPLCFSLLLSFGLGRSSFFTCVGGTFEGCLLVHLLKEIGIQFSKAAIIGQRAAKKGNRVTHSYEASRSFLVAGGKY